MLLFKSQNRFEQVLALSLILTGVILRLAPHPDNFAPTTALAIFSGVVLPPALAFTVPLLIMMVSDLWIGMHPLFWLIWPTFALVTWVGYQIRAKEGVLPLLSASIAGSVVFFVISNLGVFLFENMYAKSWRGLVECFTMAIPFFRNAFLGDLFYTTVFFSLFSFAKVLRTSF